MSGEPAGTAATLPSDDDRRFWKRAFGAYLVVIGAISGAAYLRILPRWIAVIPYFDAGAHFILLGLASYLSHRALGGRRIGRLPLGPLVVGAVAVTDEIVQAFVPWRTFSALDMVGNLGGVVLFGALAVRAVNASPKRA
jgi:VanZ family protein